MSRGPAEVLRADRVEELAELLDLVFLLVRDRHTGLIQISSAAKIEAPVRSARAIESDGRALTSLPLEKMRSA